LKKKTGPLAYVVAALKALRENHPVIDIQGAGPDSGQLVLLGNGRFYGGSFEVFPGASLRDGLLDVCVLPTVSFWRPLQLALGMASGQVHRFWASRHFRCATLTLRSSSRVGLQLDGEYAGELPATFSVLPQALRVIVP
jgi:diacylglycerol kinase family enzyme